MSRNSAVADVRATHLISAADAVASRDDIVFLEVEPWNPHAPADAPAPERKPGIAGAIRSSIVGDFGSREKRDPGEGGRPLPSPAELQQTVQQWGLDRDTPVVAYVTDPNDFRSATRAWFTLRWAGLDNVRVLDGQLPAWIAAGGEVTLDEPVQRERSAFVVTPGVLPTIDADTAAIVGLGGVLLDARPTKAYIGDPKDHSTGHIPGAFSAPSSDIVRDGFLRPEPELRAWFENLGLTQEAAVARGAYCGGGVAAAALVFAASTLGIEIPLYVASWSGWSAESRAAEQGDPHPHPQHQGEQS